MMIATNVAVAFQTIPHTTGTSESETTPASSAIAAPPSALHPIGKLRHRANGDPQLPADRLDPGLDEGAALRGNTHVQVQSGSQLPRSKAARQAAIQDVLGLYFQYLGNQPLDRRMLSKVLREYEAGALEKLFGDVSVDEEQINRENREIAGGDMELPINVYDDHKMHLEGHKEFQKKSQYEMLDLDTKQAFERHIQLHRQQLLAQMSAGTPQQPQLPAGGGPVQQEVTEMPAGNEQSAPPEQSGGAPAGAQSVQAPQAPQQPGA